MLDILRGRSLRIPAIAYPNLLWLGDNLEPEGDYRKALLVYIAANRDCLEKEATNEL